LRCGPAVPDRCRLNQLPGHRRAVGGVRRTAQACGSRRRRGAARHGSCIRFRGWVAKNRREAERWYRLAGDAGNARAQNSVGSLLQEKRRYTEALGWYEKAAASGYPYAINNAGYLYDLGLGTTQDRVRAREYYQRAADFGWPEAMWNLANAYVLGQGGPADVHLGCIWTFRADKYKYAMPQEIALHQRVAAGEAQMSRTLAAEELDRCKEEAAHWSPQSILDLPFVTAFDANQDGDQALDAGRFEDALRSYGKALTLAERAADAQYRAIAMYGLARANAHLCRTVPAEKWFRESIALRETLLDDGSATVTQNWLEFARFLRSAGRPEEAVPYFERAVRKLDSMHVERMDPIGYADVLDDFVVMLMSTGKIEESKPYGRRAAQLRLENPRRVANFQAVAYPTACGS
jgi:tetratricopeptide (TPR) repeat protein